MNNKKITSIMSKSTVGTSIKTAITCAKSANLKASNEQFFAACNIALLRGATIPAYETAKGEKVEENSLHLNKKDVPSLRDLALKTDISKSYIGDFDNSIRFIIDNGLFDLYVIGVAKFNIRSLRVLMNDDNRNILVDDKHSLRDLVCYSEDSLKDMLKRDDNTADDNGSDDNGSADDTTTGDNGTADDKIIDVVINGDTYTVAESIFNDFIAKCNKKAENTKLTA